MRLVTVLAALATLLPAMVVPTMAHAATGWWQDTFVPLERESFPRLKPAYCDREVRRVPSAKYPSIESALTGLRPRTKVVVSAGEYRENTDEWFALRLATDRVCLVARGRVTVRSKGQKYGLLLSGSRVHVSGLRLTGFEVGVSLGRDDSRTQRRVTLTGMRIAARTTGWSEGVVAYPDHRDSGRPVLDGLLLSDVRLRHVVMGVSCNAGPCWHLRLNRVSVRARAGAGESGADAIAVESGRQVVVTGGEVSGAGGDGIDIKGSDVLVRGTTVRAARNGVKLWQGGDVQGVRLLGTGADAALVGDGAGRYRYRDTVVRRHDPGGNGYVGTWGYDSQAGIRLQIEDSEFADNASGGLYVPSSASIWLVGNRFADVGTKLLDVGGEVLPNTAAGLRRLEQSGWGRNNRQ